MTLGERIRELRKAGGLSQEQLAEKMEVSRQAISKWELGTSFPDVDRLIALSDFFQVSIDQLIRGNVYETADSKEVNIEEIARQNWYHRKMTIMIIIGTLSIMLGALLRTMNAVTSEIEYLLYRSIVVGEWPDIDVGNHGPFQIVIVLFGIGCLILLICFKEAKRPHK